MNKFFKENINKINNLNYLIKNVNCHFFLKKNGKIKYAPLFDSFNQYFCIIKKILYGTLIKFPNLYSSNENEIVKKLLIIKYSQKFNLKYIPLDNYIYLFNNNVQNIIKNIMLLSYVYDNKKLIKINNYFYGNIIKKLTTSFMILKKTSHYSNENILITIFYKFYIYLPEFKNNLLKKYGKELNDFANYHELYIFLKKKGYVKRYYNDYAQKMIKNYSKFYKKLECNKSLKKYEKNIEIIDFNKIDLLNYVDKYVSNNFNKIYIKNKFIDLSKKYNI